MKAKKPLIVTFIGDVYLLSSLLLIVSLFPKFPLRVGFSYIAVPFLSENIIKIFLCVVLLILSYGYLRLKKWGYWLMVTYNIFLLIIYMVGLIHNKQLYAYPNAIISIVIGLVFILPTKKYFCEKIST